MNIYIFYFILFFVFFFFFNIFDSYEKYSFEILVLSTLSMCLLLFVSLFVLNSIRTQNFNGIEKKKRKTEIANRINIFGRGSEREPNEINGKKTTYMIIMNRIRFLFLPIRLFVIFTLRIRRNISHCALIYLLVNEQKSDIYFIFEKNHLFFG